MKRVYALLFNLSIISTHSVAKSNQIETKHPHNQNNKVVQKNIHKKDDNFKLANYKVKNGDTLFSIAREHHTTVSQVELVNKLKKDERLKLGRVLKVPTNTYKPTQKSTTVAEKKAPKSKYLTHTTKSGDTLLALAIKNQTTVKKIVEINNFSKDKKLKLGETILLPRGSKEEHPSAIHVAKIQKKSNSAKSSKKVAKTEKDFHIIKKGDTLYKIASANNTTVAKIKKLNKITTSNNLKLGQKILLTENKKSAKSLHLTKENQIKRISKSLQLAKKSQKIEKSENQERVSVATTEITDSAKVFSIADETTRFTQRKVKSQARSEQRSIFELLGMSVENSNSSLELASAKKHLGKRYVLGSNGPKTFDCSGFTQYVCDKNGICIPRTSISQSRVGQKVGNLDELKAGDLIFFDTSRRHRGYVNHVGIYIGDNKFIHASSAQRKVVITSLKRPFYKSRFKWGSRIKS